MDGLTYELQEEKLDIVKLYEAVKNVIASLEDWKSMINCSVFCFFNSERCPNDTLQSLTLTTLQC